MIDTQTLASAWMLAIFVGACFGAGILSVAGIIHLIETRNERPRRRTRRSR